MCESAAYFVSQTYKGEQRSSLSFDSFVTKWLPQVLDCGWWRSSILRLASPDYVVRRHDRVPGSFELLRDHKPMIALSLETVLKGHAALLRQISLLFEDIVN